MTALEFQYKLIGLDKGLMRYAYCLTTNLDDAKDLVQDTLLKALQHCDKFVYDTNIRAWTYTIMKNTFINNYRRSIRQNTISDKTKEGLYIHDKYAIGSDDPDSVYAYNEIGEIINSLDDNLKLPFKMSHAGFKYKEIAENLDLNIGTVKSRIFFARKILMKQLNA